MYELEVRGEWWEPVKNEEGCYEIPPKQDRVAGELSYMPSQGATLDLIGKISPGFLHEDDVDERATIHGQTTDGNLVTLLNCFVSNSTNNYSDIWFESESYYSGRVLVGDLLNISAKFWKLSFSTQSLSKWTNTRIEDSPGTERFPTGPAMVRGVELGGVDLTLKMWENVESLTPGYPGSAHLEIWPSSPMTISTYLDDYLVPLRIFLNLGIRKTLRFRLL